MWLVDGAIEIYRRMSTDFLPTPAKSHYVFNLRDLSKCVQGLLKADIKVIRTKVFDYDVIMQLNLITLG